MSGWIKLHRKFSSWGWSSKPEMVSLFVHLLLAANFEDKMSLGTLVKRGQVIFGREKWAEKLGISPQSLRTCIERLKSTSEISVDLTSKFSIITIVNYEEYQLTENESTSEIFPISTADQPAINQQSTTPKNIRKKESNTPIPPLIEEMSFPEWVPPNFKDFLELRKSLRAKNTTLAVNSLLKMLKVIVDKGYKAEEIVENSIRNSWKDLYLPKVPPGAETKSLAMQMKRVSNNPGWK